MNDQPHPIRLGVSSCLLGNNVRYDGQHKLDHFVRDTLGRYVAFVPVCPEVECGLSIPREAMRLVGSVEAPRLMTQRTGIDHTERMQSWAARRVVELEKENLCGFVFKAKSPSSGMERVKVYNDRGGMAGQGVGLFARAFMDHFPLLPVEDDGRLHDADLRENFIERIFALQRYREACLPARRKGDLVSFHARHKFLIQAHDPARARVMGALLGQSGITSPRETATIYEALLLETLRLHATPRKHANILQHMMGFLKTLLSADEKQELLTIIDAYRNTLVPLIAPVTLLQHYIRKYDVAYLKDQVYLQPHPLELKLRNHA